MKKELIRVYKEIVNLSKVIKGLLKEEEPNMQELLGMGLGDTKEMIHELEGSDKSSDELTIEDLGILQNAIKSIKTCICDYYAEKYSNDCNVQ